MGWFGTSRGYERQLAEVRERLLLMSGRVEEMIDQSIRALVERDAELARQTVLLDRHVNQAEIANDELCLELLRRWRLPSQELLFVTRALKMVTDLERIGDLAVNIAERAVDLSAKPPLAPYEDLPRLTEYVRTMVHDATDAFVEGDVDLARAVIERDDEVDDLYSTVFESVLEIMRHDGATVHRGIHVLSVAKWLERIGDHATNLAEEVILLVDGTSVRHAGKLS